VLSGSLEISNRNIVSGAVRLCYALTYSLFLGFGLAIGAQMFERVTGTSVKGPEDYSCSQTHVADGPWWQRTPSTWWGACRGRARGECADAQQRSSRSRCIRSS
jgi:hypothetical protein